VVVYIEDTIKNIADNLEAEKCVLGAMLVDVGLIPLITDELTGEEFGTAQMRGIYKLFVKVYRLNPKEFTVITAADALFKATKRPRADVQKFLGDCMSLMPSAQVWQSYTKIVKNNYIMRTAATIFDEKVGKMTTETAGEVLQEIVSSLNALSRTSSKQALHKLGDILAQYYVNLFEKDKAALLDFGILGLDGILGGIGADDLTILAARPSTGKTAFAVEIVKSLLMQDKKVAFYSLEMAEYQILNRMMSSISNVPHSSVKRHDVADHANEIATGAGIMTRWENNLFLNDTSNIRVSQIRNECTVNPVDVIIVDHIGLITPEERHRDLREAISEISRNLKILASDLRTPIIVLCQLNREVERRNSPIPMLADLRESGTIEQDANNVIFLFKTDRNDENSDIGVSVAKNRNGSLGVVVKTFDRETQSFGKNFYQYSSDDKSGNKDRASFN
jgi:replicative DNA helicase